ncbi:MAG: cell envelope biogenesis protein TolA [Rhodobacteraceae bacterium]|nr:cell envelope biogenesis protein TolA [Paracoccaceae bacterium]
MTTGQIVSAVGHLCLLLWIVIGDWLFSPEKMPEVTVAEVSLMNSSEFDELVKASPAPAPSEPVKEKELVEPSAKPVVTDPVEPPPAVEDIPEDVPVLDAFQPIETPNPVAPIADTEQPIPVAPSDVKPKPRPLDRVAAVPVDSSTDAPDVADVATPEASDEAAPDAPVVEKEPPAAPEEATTQIVTEAVETEDNAPQLPAMASLPPRSRPKNLIKPEKPLKEEVASAKPASKKARDDLVADAIAAAVADAATEETTDAGEANAPSGPPMTGAETDAMRVAVQACWNVGALSMEALRTTVVVGFSVNQNGKPDAASIHLVSSDGGSDVSTGQAFEAARRAIIRCGSKGFPLPKDKYEQWKEIELVFDPNGMRMR